MGKPLTPARCRERTDPLRRASAANTAVLIGICLDLGVTNAAASDLLDAYMSAVSAHFRDGWFKCERCGFWSAPLETPDHKNCPCL